MTHQVVAVYGSAVLKTGFGIFLVAGAMGVDGRAAVGAAVGAAEGTAAGQVDLMFASAGGAAVGGVKAAGAQSG